MKTKNGFIISTLILFLVGCMPMNTTDEKTSDGRNEDLMQINNEIKELHQDTGYEKSKRRHEEFDNTKQAKEFTDIYTDEQTEEISNYLNGLDYIRQSQVASTEDKILVGVILENHTEQDLASQIEEEVKQFVKQKTIVVYTDDTYWNRRKNLGAKQKPMKLGRDVEKYLDDFFNIKLKEERDR